MRKSVLSAGVILAGLIIVASHPTARAEEVSTQSITSPTPVVVQVVKGDSLSKIANKHTTTYQRLFDANTSIADPDVIHPGDQIRIPDPSEVLSSRTVAVQTTQVQVETPKPVAKPKAQQPKKPVKKAVPKQTKIQTNAAVVADGSVWDALARCESGGNWSINTGNGYYGGLQFTAGTWKAVGGSGLPSQNSREEQIYRAQILQARSGWGQWPACTAKLGLR